MSLNQIELVWVRVRVEKECFWVNLREDNKVSESKMAMSESNMAEFLMAAIIKLSQNEWVKYFLYKMAELRMADFKIAAIIKLSQNEWVKFFCANVGNQSWQVWVSLREKTKMVESKMVEFKLAEFKMAAIIKLSQKKWVKFFCANGWIQYVRIQYGCHHQVESESMSEVFVVQNGWIQDGCHHQVESEWMTLSQIELVGVRVLSKMAESKMSEFKMAEYKMAAIIKLSENEWLWVRLN